MVRVSVTCPSAGASTGWASRAVGLGAGARAASCEKAAKVEKKQKKSVVVKWRIPWWRERRGLKYQQFWDDLAS
jgi:hypothetical protein